MACFNKPAMCLQMGRGVTWGVLITQQSYYTGGCLQQAFTEGHAHPQRRGCVWLDRTERGRGVDSGGRGMPTAHWPWGGKGHWVCGEGRGAGAQEDPRPASDWLGPFCPVEPNGGRTEDERGHQKNNTKGTAVRRWEKQQQIRTWKWNEDTQWMMGKSLQSMHVETCWNQCSQDQLSVLTDTLNPSGLSQLVQSAGRVLDWQKLHAYPAECLTRDAWSLKKRRGWHGAQKPIFLQEG